MQFRKQKAVETRRSQKQEDRFPTPSPAPHVPQLTSSNSKRTQKLGVSSGGVRVSYLRSGRRKHLIHSSLANKTNTIRRTVKEKDVPKRINIKGASAERTTSLQASDVLASEEKSVCNQLQLLNCSQKSLVPQNVNPKTTQVKSRSSAVKHHEVTSKNPVVQSDSICKNSKASMSDSSCQKSSSQTSAEKRVVREDRHKSVESQPLQLSGGNIGEVTLPRSGLSPKHKAKMDVKDNQENNESLLAAAIFGRGVLDRSEMSDGPKTSSMGSICGEGVSSPLCKELCGSLDSSESSDSEDSGLSGDERKFNEGGWRARMASNAPRRSARLCKQIHKFDPSARPSRMILGSKDIFGDICTTSKRTRQTASALTVKTLVRESQRSQKREAENNALRENMEATASAIGKEEQEFKSLADMTKQIQEQQNMAARKYSSPLFTFCKPICIPASLIKGPSFDRNEVDDFHDLLVDIFTSPLSNVGISMIGSVIGHFVESGVTGVLPAVASTLMNFCVFEKGLETIQGLSRDILVDALLKLIRSRRIRDEKESETDYPSLLFVLRSHGAVLDTRPLLNPPDAGVRQCTPGSLDAISSKTHAKRGNSLNDLAIGIRNIGRACRVTAAQIESGWTWQTSMGFKPKGEKEGIVQTVLLCTKVLLSAFGSRVKRECGMVINAAIMRLLPEDWPAMRWEIAKSITMLTTRLQLHVELVTHLFPFDCERSLMCSLDLAFLSLVQWSEGPGKDPIAKDISEENVSMMAASFGLQSISFCAEDLLRCLGNIPELCRDTDVFWACGVAHLLKQVLSMPVVLERRKVGDFELLSQTIDKLRQCTHRMKCDFVVQEMRMALDALIRSLRFIGSGHSGNVADLNSLTPNGI